MSPALYIWLFIHIIKEEVKYVNRYRLKIREMSESGASMGKE
jgi:hypothetical protein